eukprot:3690263-Lingulodinium_polyedra.AAC.1
MERAVRVSCWGARARGVKRLSCERVCVVAGLSRVTARSHQWCVAARTRENTDRGSSTRAIFRHARGSN